LYGSRIHIHCSTHPSRRTNRTCIAHTCPIVFLLFRSNKSDDGTCDVSLGLKTDQDPDPAVFLSPYPDMDSYLDPTVLKAVQRDITHNCLFQTSLSESLRYQSLSGSRLFWQKPGYFYIFYFPFQNSIFSILESKIQKYTLIWYIRSETNLRFPD
jgi:hypothetical protein